MKKIISWLDENLEEFLMLILLAMISVIIMLQVIMRYCFGHALSWPEEFTRFCFVYTGCLSAGYCIRKGAGIRVRVIRTSDCSEVQGRDRVPLQYNRYHLPERPAGYGYRE